MNRLIPLLAIGTVLSTPALALDKCMDGADSQTRVCVYNPLQRYVVNSLVGFPVNLQFGSDEHLKRFEPAYTGKDDQGKPTATWRGPTCKTQAQSTDCPVDKFKNNLPIWAFGTGHSAAVVVTTTNEGDERTYLFDLNAEMPAQNCDPARPQTPYCPEDPGLTTGISFTYPTQAAAAAKKQTEEQRKASVAAWQQKQAEKKEQEAKDRLRVDPFYCPAGGCNDKYDAKGDPRYASLAPKRVWDNGMITTMVWPHNVPVPAISVVNVATDKPDHIAPLTASNLASQDGQMYTLPGTAKKYRLSIGKNQVVDVINERWNPDSPDPGTGTPSPDVLRTVIQAKQQ